MSSIAHWLDPAVVDAFRASGPRWQTRINAALRDWLQHHSPVDLEA
ncbi:BrnA antitoxin family protein [Pigmentiphaga humi]|nr:BrnA antitoxin family protein [Pigmentiphaga humi]